MAHKRLLFLTGLFVLMLLSVSVVWAQYPNPTPRPIYGSYPQATPNPANVIVIPVGATSVIDDILNDPQVVTPYPTAAYTNATVPDAFLQVGDTAYVTAGPLNVRTNPNTTVGNIVLGQLQQGEDVTVLGLSPDLQWVYIDTRGPLFTQGWVSALYIEKAENFQPFAPSITGGDSTGMTVRAVETVNIRQRATLFSPRVGILPANGIAEIIGRKSTYGWWKVRLSNGTVGWVSATYVRPENPAAYYSVPVIID